MSKLSKKNAAEIKTMCETVLASFDDARGVDVRVLDVRKLTDITDYMVVATGTSDRHVKTLADRVLEFMGNKGWKPIGMEGEDNRDWILVDFVDVVVHIMRDKTRKHYDLESLWDETFDELGQSRDASTGSAS